MEPEWPLGKHMLVKVMIGRLKKGIYFSVKKTKHGAAAWLKDVKVLLRGMIEFLLGHFLGQRY